MKRKSLVIFFLIIVLSLSSITFASSLQVKDVKINFDIEPEEIENDSYLPIEQFKQLKNFSMYSIEENRFLLIYNSNYYALSLNKNEIKSNKGNFDICCKPIKINNHVLVPFQLIEKIFGKTINKSNGNNQIIDLELNLDRQQTEDEDILDVEITLNNQTDEKITLEFSTSQKYNILIKNQDNEVIYNWEKDKMFTQAFTHNTIKANNSIKFTEKIDVSDLENETYYLILTMKTNNYDIESKEVQFSINK